MQKGTTEAKPETQNHLGFRSRSNYRALDPTLNPKPQTLGETETQALKVTSPKPHILSCFTAAPEAPEQRETNPNLKLVFFPVPS